MKPISSLKNKQVYLFGGSAGIGLEIAKQLVEAGAHVAIFSRTEERLLSAKKEIEGCRQSDAVCVDYRRVDVSKKDVVDAVISDCVKTIGAPDILVNCVGRAYPHYFEDITFDQFDDTMKVNLYGTWNTCSAVVPIMKEKGGWIVNTSSIAGFLGVYGYTDYTASKFAIIGFSETLRYELEQYHIGVTVLCPPDTDTPGFKTENETKPYETKLISEGARIMTAAAVARECIDGLKRGKNTIIPGLDGKLTYFARRFAPSVVEFYMKKSIRKAQRLKGAEHSANRN